LQLINHDERLCSKNSKTIAAAAAAAAAAAVVVAVETNCHLRSEANQHK